MACTCTPGVDTGHYIHTVLAISVTVHEKYKDISKSMCQLASSGRVFI